MRHEAEYPRVMRKWELLDEIRVGNRAERLHRRFAFDPVAPPPASSSAAASATTLPWLLPLAPETAGVEWNALRSGKSV